MAWLLGYADNRRRFQPEMQQRFRRDANGFALRDSLEAGSGGSASTRANGRASTASGHGAEHGSEHRAPSCEETGAFIPADSLLTFSHNVGGVELISLAADFHGIEIDHEV